LIRFSHPAPNLDARRSSGWLNNREQKRGVGTARGCEFDAIVLDVMLPKMSGFELAKKLRGEQITTPGLMPLRKIRFPEPDPAPV